MLLLWIQMPAYPIRGSLREEPEAWEPDVPETWNCKDCRTQVSLRTVLVRCQRAIHLGVFRLRFR